MINSEIIQKSNQVQSGLDEACQQICHVYCQKNLLASRVEESKKKLENFQSQWFGIPFRWHQSFPSERYSKILQKLQDEIQLSQKLYEEYFLDISFDFTPSEREKWNTIKNLFANQALPIWNITEENATEEFRAENGKYSVSNLTLKECLVSVSQMDVFHSAEPYIFLGKEMDECLYIYPSFAIIINPTDGKIVPLGRLDVEVTRVFLIANDVPQGIKAIDTVWKYAKKKGGRDLRYTKNEKRFILEYFKLEIRTNSNQSQVFLFGREDIVNLFVAIFSQQAGISLVQSGNQEVSDNWKKSCDFVPVKKAQKSKPKLKDGCCGRFFLLVTLIFLLMVACGG